MAQPSNTKSRGAVLIADDHEVFCFGLGQLLKDSLGAQTVHEAHRFDEAIDLLDENELFLAIFDLGIPGLTTPLDLAVVRRERPDVRVVVLSASEKREDILAALEAGVHGYIVKTQSTDELLDKLRYVLSGEIYVPPILAQHAPPPPAASPRPGETNGLPAAERLSVRQLEVLGCLMRGCANKDIGRELDVSESTVKMHVAAIFRALGVNNRAHAAALGQKILDQLGDET